MKSTSLTPMEYDTAEWIFGYDRSDPFGPEIVLTPEEFDAIPTAQGIIDEQGEQVFFDVNPNKGPGFCMKYRSEKWGWLLETWVDRKTGRNFLDWRRVRVEGFGFLKGADGCETETMRNRIRNRKFQNLMNALADSYESIPDDEPLTEEEIALAEKTRGVLLAAVEKFKGRKS